MKKIIMKFGSVFASLALLVTAVNTNSVCMFVAHQPQLPAGADKLKKRNR